MNSGTNNDSSSLIEDELLEEMKLIQSNENSGEPLLSQIEAAMENIRVASERNSPRRNSGMSRRERHSLDASSENSYFSASL